MHIIIAILVNIMNNGKNANYYSIIVLIFAKFQHSIAEYS